MVRVEIIKIWSPSSKDTWEIWRKSCHNLTRYWHSAQYSIV